MSALDNTFNTEVSLVQQQLELLYYDLERSEESWRFIRYNAYIMRGK